MAHVGEELRLGQGRGLRDGLGPLEIALCLLALDELADLPPHGFEHPEDVLVGLADLVAEELHYAEEPARAHDGKAERSMQAATDRIGRSRKVAIERGVGNPRRAPALPDASGQADAGGKCAAPVDLGKFLESLSGRRPHLRTTE